MAIDFSTLPGASSSISGTSASSAAASSTDSASSDRFLKLLVTQMQNQDPLNPMDNAQVTSQMAQINTVNGIEKLNTTVSGLNSQFIQLQSLQAATLVGHDVWLQGNALQVTNGVGEGAFNLDGAADSVKVEILNGAGKVVDTLNLGAQSAGRQEFNYAKGALSDDGAQYTFRVTALSGAKPVTSTALMLDHVDSVGIDGDTLTLALTRGGDTPYSQVLAIH
jgi:flagellar basal-body rod modification protein FlgD